MSPDTVWEVPQTIDTIDPRSEHYNAKSAYAKTLRRDGVSWGDVPEIFELQSGTSRTTSRIFPARSAIPPGRRVASDVTPHAREPK